MSAGRPTRAQCRAHRTQIARRLGLRRSLVRVATSRPVGLACVAVRVRGVVRLAEAFPPRAGLVAVMLLRLRALSWPSGVEAARAERASARAEERRRDACLGARRRGRARS